MTLLSATSVTYRIKGRTILDDISVSIAAGERVALVGPSGSGKTSLLTLMAGLGSPDSGEIVLGHAVIADADQRVGLVLQGYGLLPLLTATENIEATLRARGVSPADAMARSGKWLDVVGLSEHHDHLVEELSGGQQQRVAVARGLALDVRVLLADEPTAEQDSAHRSTVLQALLDNPPDSGAVVIATHDPEIANACDRIIRMREGRLETDT